MGRTGGPTVTVGTFDLMTMDGHKRPGTLSSVWEGLKNFALLVLPSGFNNVASSLRFVGSASNWQEDRLHLYFSEFFAGGEEVVLGNTQELRYNDMATSLIVTGCEPWTVFQDRRPYHRIYITQSNRIVGYINLIFVDPHPERYQ